MNGLALCAGVGGMELGLRLALGERYRLVGAVERREVARRLLWDRSQYLGGPIVLGDDIRNHDFRRWAGCVDILSAGWPCQGFSTASRGRPRHPDLWRFVRRAIVHSRSRAVFLENVNTAPWTVVERQLECLGFRTARDRFCPADLGAPHRRPRTFLLAYANRESESLGTFDEEVAGLSPTARRDPVVMPRILRMDDGAPGRMDRFRFAGEGVVPAVAARAFVTLARMLADG